MLGIFRSAKAKGKMRYPSSRKLKTAENHKILINHQSASVTLEMVVIAYGLRSCNWN